MTPSGQKLLMLVDGEPAQQRLVTVLAARGGWRTIIAEDSESALATLGTRDGMMLDAVLIDQAAPGSEVADLLAEIQSRRPALPVMILTAFGSVDVAVAAMRAGAADFLVKPIAPVRLMAALDGAVGVTAAIGELRPLTEKLSAPLSFGEIAGSDPKFRAALAIAAKAARSRVPVLIEGEGGVGKQLVAEAIHAASAREKKPFVQIDCASLPANQIASELFGHEAGAFAGAFSRQAGAFSRAEGGTLFIDSVELIPFDVQQKLLEAIETGDYAPLGGRTVFGVDVRVIATANPSLREEMDIGRFREDLYFKLATVNVALPPLRERMADLPALARHLLARIGGQPGMRALGITDDALSILSAYHWPSNVRQLHNALFRAAALCDGDALTADDFPEIVRQSRPRSTPAPRQTEAGVTLYTPDGNLRALIDIEADVIRLAIGHYRGRMTEVARRLGIGRSTLYRKLADLGISEVA